MEKSTVILVGNGPSLLDNKNGEIIDSYEKVVRFNLYNTKNHQEYTGIKTNTWFTVCNVRITPREVDEIYFHVWYKNKTNHPYYHNLTKTFNNVKVIENSLLDEMKEEFKVNYNMFSTGLIAIYLMLKQHEHITLTGFDWWDPNYKLHHYFDSKQPQFDPNKDKGHKPQLEKEIIDSYKKRIKFLGQ